MAFVPADGGVGRACRGAAPADNAASYYMLFSGVGIEGCETHCAAVPGCKGIEHHSSSGRCEVWTRAEGIGATASAPGYTCLRYEASTAVETTTAMTATSRPPVPAPVPVPTVMPRQQPTPAPPSTWDGSNMKMTHYWDCNGQGCDASTLQPWDEGRYVSPPGYSPQDPADFGGPVYGEAMWLTGAASDALSALMGPDDGCCGGDPNDGGIGGCGKCALVQNPDSLHPDWTAVVMKKNRCPPWSNGCGAGEPHFDIAAPGFDNLQWSTANVCGLRSGTGFESQAQSETVGSWWKHCASTAECAHLCEKLPSSFQKGCKLFASWGWFRGDPDRVKFRAISCPAEFVRHVGSLFDAQGPVEAPVSAPALVQRPPSARVRAPVRRHGSRQHSSPEPQQHGPARHSRPGALGFLSRSNALVQMAQKMGRYASPKANGEAGASTEL